MSEPNENFITPVTPEVKQALTARLSKAFGERSQLTVQVESQLEFYGVQANERLVIETLETSPNRAQYAWFPHIEGSFDTVANLVGTIPNRRGTPLSQGVYIHANPIRRNFTLKIAGREWLQQPPSKGKEESTAITSSDVEWLRVLPIDIDVDRPSGTSGTKEECDLALQVASRIYLDLQQVLGTDESLGFLFSGNGVQVHLRLDNFQPTEDNVRQNKRLLLVLGQLYDKPGVYHVDRVLSDPRRIVPLAGTWKRKGGNDVEEGRVHRLTWFTGPSNPPRGLTVERMTQLLETLEGRLTDEQRAEVEAKLAPEPTSEQAPAASSVGAKEFFARAAEIPIQDVLTALGRRSDRGSIECPGCGQGRSKPDKDIKIFQDGGDGVWLLKCYHPNSCGWCGSGVNLVSQVLVGKKCPRKADAAKVMAWYRHHFKDQVPAEMSKSEHDAAKLRVRVERKRKKVLGEPAPSEVVLTGSEATEDETRQVEITVPAAEVQESDEYTAEDWGVAERFIEQHGANVRFCTLWNSWLIWNGKVWIQDLKGNTLIKQLARLTVRQLHLDAASLADDTAAEEAFRFAERHSTKNKMESFLALAQGLPGVQAHPDELDADPWILNTPSGIVDLKTGALLPHRREALCTKITKVPYPTEDLPHPKWDRYFAQVQPDPEQRDWIMKYDGYSLTGSIRQHLLVIHIGTGRNGKGVHQKVQLGLLGEYAGVVPPEILVVGRGSHQAAINERHRARLFRKRMVFSSETDQRTMMNVSEVKQLTGNDRLNAKRLWENDFEFEPTHKLQLSTQNEPIVTETKNAIWDRLRLVPWRVVLPPEEQQTDLSEVLIAEEGPAILRMLVQACLRWQTEGLEKLPAEIASATASYRTKEDILGQFLDSDCNEGEGLKVQSSVLYRQYDFWCKQSNHKPQSLTTFGASLTERGFTKSKDPKGRNIYLGIAIKHDAANDDGDTFAQLRNASDLEEIARQAAEEAVEAAESPSEIEISENLEVTEGTEGCVNGSQILKNEFTSNSETLKELKEKPSVPSVPLLTTPCQVTGYVEYLRREPEGWRVGFRLTNGLAAYVDVPVTQDLRKVFGVEPIPGECHGVDIDLLVEPTPFPRIMRVVEVLAA